MDERYAAKLARHRVDAEAHMGLEMTPEEVILRRQYMRSMLTVNPIWKGCTDEQIDSMRLYHAGDDWLLRILIFMSIDCKGEVFIWQIDVCLR